MNTARLKNIVIVILAVTNAFLLVLLATRRTQEHSARTRAVNELVRLYASGGVELSPSIVPRKSTLPAAADPVRDLDREAALAASILGECRMEDVGGGIFRYVGETGQCLLRSSGSVEAELERAVDDPEKFCERLFAEYGYSALSSDVYNGTGSVAAVRMLQNGSAIFNAVLTLTFSEYRLTAASGSFVPPIETEESGEGIDGITALAGFLNYSEDSGEVCTSVQGIHSGYLLQSTASVSQHLIPTWCITTDASTYYVNIATGEITREN
ncbi:MAG: hypothetical protein J5449_08825 [Oscillospiraceae bacterium]|nr:hypothetical protein [Oscillospiraceae bacterium]